LSHFETKTIEELTDTLIDYRGKTPEKTTDGVKLITAKVIKDGFIQEGNHEFIAKENYDSWMRKIGRAHV
jgi:type I restriction enzyme S subunit